MNIKTMTRCALMAALICVLAPLSIPLSSLVPISLGSLMVMLAGAVLGSKEGTLSVLIYLLCGAVGLPVFAGYSSGLSDLFGVTGGFLFGYLPLAFFSGRLYEIRKTNGSLLSGMIVGNIVLYIFGTVWFMIYLKTNLEKALTVCVLPFLLGDIIKMNVVYFLARSSARPCNRKASERQNISKTHDHSFLTGAVF